MVLFEILYGGRVSERNILGDASDQYNRKLKLAIFEYGEGVSAKAKHIIYQRIKIGPGTFFCTQ